MHPRARTVSGVSPNRISSVCLNRVSSGSLNRVSCVSLNYTSGASLNCRVVLNRLGAGPGAPRHVRGHQQPRQTVQCSSREFYRDASYTKSNKTIRHWFDYGGEEGSEATRLMPTKKTCSLAKLEAYDRYMVPRFDMLLGFAMRRKFRDLRFRRYCQPRKKLHKLCSMVVAGRDPAATIVGFGDWSCTDFGVVLKKCPGGPTKWFQRELAKYCRVELESEYRSSKVHLCCRQTHPGDLVNQYQRQECRDGVVRTRKIHSVLHCLRNNGRCGIIVNRDVNASRNILRAFQLRLSGQPRPQ